MCGTEDGWVPGPVWTGAEKLYSITALIGVNWDEAPFGCAENLDNWIFFIKHWQFEVDTISTDECFRLHIYPQIILIHYLTLGGGDLSHEKMEYSYSKEMLIRRAKTSRIIGGPDNQRPDKWNPTVFTLIYLVAYSRRTHNFLYIYIKNSGCLHPTSYCNDCINRSDYIDRMRGWSDLTVVSMGNMGLLSAGHVRWTFVWRDVGNLWDYETRHSVSHLCCVTLHVLRSYRRLPLP